VKHLFILLLVLPITLGAEWLVPMDRSQTDHLKAYGAAYWAVDHGFVVEWLLNYRGGSFLFPQDESVARQCRIMGVSFETVTGSGVADLYQTIESNNMDRVRLEKAPRIAIYTPPNKKPWDDAVTLALTYAEIPYETLWDKSVLTGGLEQYDWLHLHHEDFTGQFGKFYASYRNAEWYQNEQRVLNSEAKELGFSKVSKLKLSVALAIRSYVEQGGFLFSMCSATDSYDIALSAIKTDICDAVFDGDPIDSRFMDKLDYAPCLAFEKFTPIPDPMVYEFSDIDTPPGAGPETGPSGYFSLFEFSAKYDPVPTMLNQCHVSVVKDFYGQTTAFRKDLVKPSVVVLAEKPGAGVVKYLHGNLGKGTYTFLGGHDPEDPQHLVGDPPTDLKRFPNSPGYRLILNNVLFPAAKKKEQKT
jgi:hypothetical protein